MVRFRGLFLIIIGMLAAAHVPAAATTYYVRATGDDTQDGQSPTTAFSTIRRGAESITQPGDELVVGPGVYREGNIQPRGNGSPEQPAVFTADTTGIRSEDPAGPVILAPNNSQIATTGFLIFGRHDIILDGFTIQAAADAAIQIRPHPETGEDSTRIAVRNCILRDGNRRGVSAIAVGGLEISNTEVSNYSYVGISVTSGSSGSVRPRIRDSLVAHGNGDAIVTDGADRTEITGNRIHDVVLGISAATGSHLAISRNAIHDTTESAILVRPSNLNPMGSEIAIDGNLIDRSSRFGIDVRAPGTVRVTENRVGTTDNPSFHFASTSTSDVVLVANTFPVAVVENANSIDAANNASDTLKLGAKRAVVRDNSATILLDARTSDQLEFNGNQAADARASSRNVRVAANTTTGVLRVACDQTSGSKAAVYDNLAGTGIRVADCELAEVLRNRTTAGGLYCAPRRTSGRAEVIDNTVQGAPSDGLVIQYAQGGTIENNRISGGADAGLVLLDSTGLVVRNNQSKGNRGTGLLVGADWRIFGDCDDSGAATVDEIIVAVGIALGEIPWTRCRPADMNQDRQITVNEILTVIDFALYEPSPNPVIADLSIRGNVIDENGKHGIEVLAGGTIRLEGNTVLGNGASGIIFSPRATRAPVSISGNLVGGNNADGISVRRTDGGQVVGNRIFSNRDAGVVLGDTDGVGVVNNLIYANHSDGVSIGVGQAHRVAANDSLVTNNTVYANRGWGFTIGESREPTSGTVIANNILDANRLGAIAAEYLSQPDLSIRYNLSVGNYSAGVWPDSTNFRADPRFVLPPGNDGILGEGGFADDDFHLQSDSVAIDAGSASAAELGIVGSATSDSDVDTGIVDLGYHD